LSHSAFVQVISILGEQILISPEAKYHELDVSTITQGVYILKAGNNARKFIKL